MKRIAAFWQWLALRPVFFRLTFKVFFFGLVFLFVTFPNPVLSLKQLFAYRDIEALFVTDFPELPAINARIDSLLPPDYTFQQEYQAIVHFVYENIRYQYDWDNWLNSEYWPAADEVWRRGREDCDGRAILAVAIFRSRGYAETTVVGGLTHLWITVGGQELMGAQKEKTMVMQDGRKKMRVPPLASILEAAAAQLDGYPIFRMVVILLFLLLLAYHPAKNIKLLLGLCLAAVIGFVLLLDWASYVNFYEKLTCNINLVLGLVLLIPPYILAMLARRFLKT
ncbi:hypothetical protein JXA70_10630 [candidate division KSB1 bacterium]|nr:hypothetical protein [candidate division KSB1 bacterium]